MTQPTMEQAYAIACRMIGDQAVQLALMAEEAARLRAEIEQAQPTPEQAAMS